MTAGGTPIVECVPNVSEGRDGRVLEALGHAITRDPHVRLLHRDVGPDAHRTVFTFAGPPEAVGDAAIRLGHAVAAHCDMRLHHGAHPRLGALDVCPFVPVHGVSMARCVGLARRVASTLAHDLDLPVYLYEAAAFRDSRRSLVDLRRGEYEGLAQRLGTPDGLPDFGPARLSPRLGAAVVGARPFLVAWNLSLATHDVAVARAIAARVREREPRRSVPVAGVSVGPPAPPAPRLPAVRAIGWAMPSYGLAQVSLNILDHHATPLHVAHAAVDAEARRMGTHVVGSELIGLVPADALVAAGRGLLHDDVADADTAMAAAVDGLGLAHLQPFDLDARVLERCLGR